MKWDYLLSQFPDPKRQQRKSASKETIKNFSISINYKKNPIRRISPKAPQYLYDKDKLEYQRPQCLKEEEFMERTLAPLCTGRA